MTGIDGHDWSPLGGQNPVPGDPDAVRTMADKFSDLSSTVSLQNRLLRGVSGESSAVWKGPAAEQFHAKVGPLPGQLDKLTGSYNQAASALHEYWPKLREAQGHALAALAKARAAQQAIGATQTQLTGENGQVAAAGATYNRLVGQPAMPGVKLTAAQVQSQQAAQLQAQADYQAAQARAANTQSQLNAARQSLSDAHTQCAQAVSMAQAAVSACATHLKAASKAGIQNPHHSFWGSIASGVVDVVDGKAETSALGWVAHHAGDIEFAASLSLGPAGLLLTAKGRGLVHEALKAAEPELKFVSAGLGIVTGVLGVASLVLAPIGVGEVLDGANEVLMGLKTADDGLLLAAGDREAEGELVADGIGMATLGVGDAIGAGTETLKAAFALGEDTDKAANAGEALASATETAKGAGEAATKADRLVSNASAAVDKASGLADRADGVLGNASAKLAPRAERLSDVMHTRLDEAASAQAEAETGLQGARTAQAGAQRAVEEAQTEQAAAAKELAASTTEHDAAIENFDLQSGKSWGENLLGSTTLKNSRQFLSAPKATLAQFSRSNDLVDAGVRERWAKYYSGQFSGPKSVIALRAAKTAYLSFDSSGFVSKRLAGPQFALPDVAGNAVNGGGGGG